jgi:hypothetical protein
LPKYSDTIVTVVLIAACIVLSVVVVVFVSLQIYAESLYLVQVTRMTMPAYTGFVKSFCDSDGSRRFIYV